MDYPSAGKMKWMSQESGTDKILYLKLPGSDRWLPYTHFPLLNKKDYDTPKGSKGWATYQKLRLLGWELESS